MKPVVIFDIDGTLADVAHRRHWLDKKNWAMFFKEMGEDPINQPIVSLYKTLYEANNYEIHIFTGRPERYRKITESWLLFNNIPLTTLHMRKDKDNRKDSLVKQELLDHLLNQGKKILFSIDDRQQVVDMWRNNGITCLQCAPGDF